MNHNKQYCCELMDIFLEDERIPIIYYEAVKEYDIPLLYKGKITALQGIDYCPWCGKRLPKSLNDEWFSILKSEYGLDDPHSKEQEKLVPEEFMTDQWWKKRGL